MTEKNLSFKSNDKVSTIHAHVWIPDEKPVALLQILHGMQEYIERYAGFAEFLCKKGYMVVGNDHIFHGRSAASPEERGIAHTDKPDVVMAEDAFKLYRKFRGDYPDIPYFILGHSMGSYILRRLLCERAKEMDGLAGAIIIGTGSENRLKLLLGRSLLAAVTLVKGKNGYSKLIHDLSFGAPYRQFDSTGEDPANSWLSRDVDNVISFQKDSLCDFEFTLGAMKTLLRATAYDNSLSNIKKMKKELPVIFASGTEDPVGNMGKGVEEAYSRFIKAGLKNVSIHLYEGDRHEILNEVDREQVYQDLYDWMIANGG